MKNKIKTSSLLTVLALNLVFRIFTDISLYLFTLPITIPISILIYYLINVYKGKNKNITVDKPLKETGKLPLNQIPFKKSITLRILISTSAALLILVMLSFFDFWVDFIGGKNDWNGMNFLVYSAMIYPVLAFVIYFFLPKLKKLPKYFYFVIALILFLFALISFI